MSKSIGKKDMLYYINSAIMIALMLGIGQMQPIEPITPMGMKVLGVFVGLLWAWTFVDMIWPSILGMILLGFTGATTVAGAFTSGMGNYANVLLVFFCLIFGAYLDSTGLNKAIAYWFVSRKICIGRPWIFTLMLLLCGYVLGICVSLFAAIVIIWDLFYAVSDIVGFKKGDKYTKLMVVGLLYAAVMGISILPYKPLPTMILGQLETTLGLTVSFIDFAALKIAMTLPSIILYWLAMKFIFRPDISPLTAKEDYFAKYRGQKLNKEQIISAVMLVVFFVLLILPSVLPKTMKLYSVLKALGTTGTVALLVCVICFVKVDGKKLGDFQSLVRKGVSWEPIILLAVTMPLGSAITSADSGILQWMMDIFKPVLSGTSSLMFIFIFLLGSAVITQVAHNLVLGGLLTSIMCVFSLEVGANPVVVALLLNMCLEVALCTPAGSATSAVLFGNKEWVPSKDCYMYTAVIFVINFAVVMLIGLPVGTLIFG